MSHPIGAAKRMAQLTGDDETLLACHKTDETDQGHYYLVLRAWTHPDVEDAYTVSLRYAYLTDGSGSDGWTDQGVNMRCYSVRRFLRAMSEMFDAADGAVGSGDVQLLDSTGDN